MFHFKYYLCCKNFQFKYILVQAAPAAIDQILFVSPNLPIEIYILVQAAAAAMDPGGLNGGAGLGGGIPESTRYPWMSITGRSRICICICI